MQRIYTSQKPLVRTLVLFLTLFIILSGIIGSWVVGTRLLYGFYFFLYGNLGKMVLISTIIFGLLVKNRIKDIETLPKTRIKVFYLLLALFLVPLFFILGNELLHLRSFYTNIPLSLLTHTVLLLIPTLLLLGTFGYPFLRSFSKRFYKEILICLSLSILYDIAIFQVWTLWPYFSSGVLQSVHALLSLTSKQVLVIPPRTLIVNNFAVNIESACSGLDSLFLFFSLYILIALLDYKELNKVKMLLMMIPAALGLYLVNIFRVYLLVIIGAYISRNLSVQLFHTYLGMLFFILFFFLFWKLCYRWMKK